jgi:hypothetical protein
MGVGMHHEKGGCMEYHQKYEMDRNGFDLGLSQKWICCVSLRVQGLLLSWRTAPESLVTGYGAQPERAAVLEIERVMPARESP